MGPMAVLARWRNDKLAAGRMMALARWRTDFRQWEKTPGSPVCEVDLDVDRMLHARLTALVPDAGWLSEETPDTEERLDCEHLFLIDPIDGTTNFAHGFPIVSISIAFERDGHLEMGGVPARQSAYADPALAEKFKFIPALVESWQEGVPEFRPRFAEWPAITEIVQEWGTKMMLGEVSIDEGAKTIAPSLDLVGKI